MLARQTKFSSEIISLQNFLLWILNGAVTGVIIYFVTKFSLNSLVVTSSAYNVDLWYICMVIYASIIIVV